MLLLSLLMPFCALAAEKADAKKAVTAKTAYVRMEALQEGCDELKERAKRFQNEIEKRYKEIEEQKKGLQSDYAALNDRSQQKFKDSETLESKRKEFAKQQHNIEIEERDLQSYAQRIQQSVQSDMSGKIQEAVDKVARAHGWDAVQVAQLYVSPRVDITEAVTAELNNIYKADQEKQSAEKKKQAAQA
jgi:Skp family chaperone for outer membrane proteins